MKSKVLTMTYGVTAILIAFALSQPRVGAQEAVGVERSLEGVWLVTTTPRNCATGMSFPAAAFESLFTFHKGGTMSAWLQNALITITRSPSHGVWQREHGWSDYLFKFVHLRYDIGSSMYVGTQESEGKLVLSESGNEFTTDSSTTFFDTNGMPLGGGCAGAVGVRFR